MFNQDFYPSPVEIIDQMVYGYDFKNKVVLEPSAGKGDIVDYLKLNGVKEVISCENNVDLQKILSTKSKLICHDFLELTADKISHIDAIIGNPPFSNQTKHILHAFEIAPDGCEIIMLCNHDAYKNDYSGTKRQLQYIVRNHGSIENLGDCFNDAERKTGIDIGCIRLHKPGVVKGNEFEGFFMDEEVELEANGIMPYNFVRDLVNRYIAAVRLFDKQMELGVQMNDLLSSFFSSKLSFSCKSGEAPVLRNDFKKDLQKSAWTWVFQKMKMEKYTTQGLKSDINKFVEKQQEIPFTMKNIYKMIEIVIGTTSSRMDRAIIEVFDKLTEHYYDNRYNVEGWKTNSHYLIGEKFILPWMVEVKYGGGMGLKSSNNCELIEDMIKALCFITGKNYDRIPSLWDFFHAISDETKDLPSYQQKSKIYEFGKWYDYEFFEIKGYKKNTMHFKFKNHDTWAMFNQHVSRIKGYPLFEAVKRKYNKAA